MAGIAADTGASADNSDSTFSSNITLFATTVAEQAVRSTFLSLFLITGFVGNSVLIATIAQSRRLKGAVLNLSIISIAVVNLVDCIVNMPLILGASISEKWDYGEFACRLNAACVQLVSIVMIVGLFFMAVDRLISVNYFTDYTSRMTAGRTSILIIYSWTHGLGLSMPILINVIPTMVYPARYVCSVGPGTSLIYAVFVSVLGYLLPILLIFMMFIFIVKISLQKKRQENQLKEHIGVNSDDVSETENNKLWDEVNAAKYVGVLIIFWCVCEGPFLLLTAIEQYRNSDHLSPITQINDALNFQYPWQLDMAFSWMRLSYAIVLPILTFFWRKEVWLKFKNCFCCRRKKDNLKRKSNQKKNNSANNSLSLRNKKEKQEQLSNGDLSVPVLFATENGLHFQAPEGVNEDSNDESDVFPPENETSRSSLYASQNIRSRKCDVLGSGFIQQQEQDDTSDYDSNGEVDPFANANPVSLKSKSSHGSSRNISSDKKSASAKLGLLKEEVIKAIGDNISENSETKPKNHKKDKKTGIEETDSSRNHQFVENESLKRRSDSGNDSWEKGIGKKRRNKKLKSNIIKIENDTINAHSTDDKGDGESKQNDVEIPLSNDGELNHKKRKKKRKKRKKKDSDDKTAEDIEMTYENEGCTVSDDEHDIMHTVTPHVTNDDREENMLFYKVTNVNESKAGRQLPEAPFKPNNRDKNKGHRRRFSDDLDIVLKLQEEPDINLPHGAKTDRHYNRFLSHETILDSAHSENPTIPFRPLPSPRKIKSKFFNSDDNNILGYQQESSSGSTPRTTSKKNGKLSENNLSGSKSASDDLSGHFDTAFIKHNEVSSQQKQRKKKSSTTVDVK